MLRTTLRAALASVAMACSGTAAIAAIVPGHVDNFEDGTTQGWTIGLLGSGPPSAALPRNVADGGPSGPGDNYLLLTSLGGSGAGSRLTAANLGSDWQGNYTALGIGSIRLDAINLGNTDLELRLLLENPIAGPPTDAAFSSVALTLAAGGGWTHLEFSLDPADLTADVGSVAGALTNVTLIRLFHSTVPVFPGAPIVAQLGFDNITAVGPGTRPPAVPEPASWLLALTALLGVGAARRRKQDAWVTASAPGGAASASRSSSAAPRWIAPAGSRAGARRAVDFDQRGRQ